MALQGSIQSLWRRWVQRRIPARGRIELSQRSIFIVPSRAGTIFLLSLLAMFIGGVNYENSLILGLNFFLTALFLVAILQTYKNLSGVILSGESVEPGFLDDFVMYSVSLKSAKNASHESILLGFGDEAALCAVEPEDKTTISLFVPASKRGTQRPGRLLVQTLYPLGILRAWSWVDLKLEGVVYPKPVRGPKPLGTVSGSQQGANLKTQGMDDFAGLTTYAPGDPLSRVYWKVLARGMPLATKSFDEPKSTACWLCRCSVQGDLETQLQVVTYWVLKLSETQDPFGIDLGGVQIDPGTGDAHKLQCLNALALYGLDLSGGADAWGKP